MVYLRQLATNILDLLIKTMVVSLFKGRLATSGDTKRFLIKMASVIVTFLTQRQVGQLIMPVVQLTFQHLNEFKGGYWQLWLKCKEKIQNSSCHNKKINIGLFDNVEYIFELYYHSPLSW